MTRPLKRLIELLPEETARSAAIVYGGQQRQRRQTIDMVPWRQLPDLIDQQLAGTHPT